MKLHTCCVRYVYFISVARWCTCCFDLNHLCLSRTARRAKALLQVNRKDKIWHVMCYQGYVRDPKLHPHRRQEGLQVNLGRNELERD